MRSIIKLRYIERLRQEVERLLGCPARYMGTTVLFGRGERSIRSRRVVEMYELDGHSQARRCFAWAEPAANEYCRERFTCILDRSASAVTAAELMKT